MGRLVALDIGRKRTGVAATDLLQIVPNGLGFQPTHEVAQWLKEYAEKEPVSYTHLTLPTIRHRCRSRWSPYH